MADLEKVPGLVTTKDGSAYEPVEVGVIGDGFGESFIMRTQRETVLLPKEPIEAVINGDEV